MDLFSAATLAGERAVEVTRADLTNQERALQSKEAELAALMQSKEAALAALTRAKEAELVALKKSVDAETAALQKALTLKEDELRAQSQSLALERPRGETAAARR